MRTVYDVVETGTGKRDNSLLWVITTAGSDRSGICYEVRSFVTRVLDNRNRCWHWAGGAVNPWLPADVNKSGTIYQKLRLTSVRY